MTRVRKQLPVPVVCLAPILGRVLVLSSCGTPTQPNSIAGTWTGTLMDSAGQSGSASLSLSDNRHDILYGTFSYIASSCSSDSQPVIGNISGGQLSLSQTPPDQVPTSLQLTVDSTDQHLTGSYSNTNGSCSSSGTISLTKPYFPN